jgi:hypothetical protein
VACGGSDEPRPHLVPKTEWGRKLVEIDATGFIGSTGLCPGEIILDDGSKARAYRFITLTAGDAESLLDQLDEIVHDLKHAAD